MALQARTRVGAYEVISPLGAGGMGEVYRARDTKLQRDVALKILPESMARDAQRMARFEREAQVLASLNHPNIAAIYGLEESAGVRALVMELVEGETLAERLRRPQPIPRPTSQHTPSPRAGQGEKFEDLTPSPSGRVGSAGPGSGSPLAIDDALPVATQIAEALDTMDGSEGGRQLLRTLRLDGFTPGSMELFAGIAAKYRDVLAQA